MVDIQRRKKNPYRAGNNIVGSSSIRNVIAVLVFLLCIKMLFTSVGESNKPPTGVEPMGIKDQLDKSHIRRPTNVAPKLLVKKPHLNDKSPPKDAADVSHNSEEGNPFSPDEHVNQNSPDEHGEPNSPEEHVEPNSPEEHVEPNSFRSNSGEHNEEPDDEERNSPKEVKHHDEPANQHKAGIPSPGSPINKIVIDKKGTGPTKVGYVKDFLAEREKDPFRNTAVAPIDSSEKVASMTKESKVTPCLTTVDGKLERNPRCSDNDTPLIAYNAAPFPRTWCGQTIPPHGAATAEEHCTDHIVHLFSVEAPPADGKGMGPMIIKSHEDVEVHEADLETVQCDISCEQEKGMEGPLRFIDGEPWTIVQTWADSYFDALAKIERTDSRIEKFYSTQSWKSSVPLSFYDASKYDLHNRPAIDWASGKNKAVYMVDTNCNAQGSRRGKYFGAIKGVMAVDSYGGCSHNIDAPEGMDLQTSEGRIALMKQYRIVLAFDASAEKDHISKMVWEAFVSGSVPVVAGANNLREHVPPNSFIDVGDFSHWDEVAQHVKKVAEDEELWESYQKWRTDEAAIAAVDARYEFTKTGPTCRLCRWAYANKYGLGWDHEKQFVKTNHIPRQLCMSENNFVSKPFGEQWVTKSDGDEVVTEHDDGGEDSCDSMTIEGAVDIVSSKVERTVVQHDGITDFLITGVEVDADEEVHLRLIVGVRNSEGAHFPNSHRMVQTVRSPLVTSVSIQDEFSKVTVLADWVTSLKSPSEGILDIVVRKAGEGPIGILPKRIRVITEDRHPIHDKITEFFPSSFGKKMIQDFVDPLELFFPDL